MARYVNKVESVVVKSGFVICLLDPSARFPISVYCTVPKCGLKRGGIRSLLVMHLGTRSR